VFCPEGQARDVRRAVEEIVVMLAHEFFRYTRQTIRARLLVFCSTNKFNGGELRC
jgi:hypothetical protein